MIFLIKKIILLCCYRDSTIVLLTPEILESTGRKSNDSTICLPSHKYPSKTNKISRELLEEYMSKFLPWTPEHGQHGIG